MVVSVSPQLLPTLRYLQVMISPILTRINRVVVSDLLEEVQVLEVSKVRPRRELLFTLRFKFIPYKCYKKDFGVKPAQVNII